MDVGVLTGDVGVPDDLRDGRMGTQVDPDRIKLLRTQRGWSQTQLAAKSRMSPAQVRRIEQGKVGQVRGYTLDRLAKALRVDPGVLTGNVRADDPIPRNRVQMSARVSANVRLAFDLVAHKYGANAKDLIQLAPLLFTLVAESSLAARRNNLGRARMACNELCGLSSEPMLYFAKYVRDVDAGIEAEERSIASKDVLGRCIWEDGDKDGRFHEDDVIVTPFENYLTSLAEKLDAGDVRIEPVPQGMTDLWGVSSYRVCGELLSELCGEDENEPWYFSLARLAFDCGAVRVSEIPEELMTAEATPQRVKWLEDRLKDEHPDMARQAQELFDFKQKLSVDWESSDDALWRSYDED